MIEPTSSASELLGSGKVAGVEPDEPLFGVSAANLVAAVSRVSDETFSEQPFNDLLADLPRLTPFAIRHEQAIRDLFEVGTALLPMTFGAIYRSEVRVRELLQEHAADFHHRLEWLGGRQEWELKVFRRPADLLAAAAASTARRSQFGEANPPGPGRAYLLQRLQERRSVEEAGRMAAEMLQSIRDRLGSVSSETRIDTLEGGVTGEIELVCKFASLVSVAQAPELRALAGDLKSQYEPLGLSLELSGPWPPYSFVVEHDGTN